MKKEPSQQEKRELTTRCFEELRTDNSLQDINNIINENQDRLDTNFSWVMLNKHYKAWWMTSSPGILWVSGGPGKGKTQIASILAEFHSGIPREDKNKTFIYFICNYRKDNQHSALAILRSLILQLLEQRPVLIPCVVRLSDAPGENRLRNLNMLWYIFQEMIKLLGGEIYCMITRLNECSPESQRFLVNMLKETTLFKQSRQKGILKLIITSTETKDLKDLSEHKFSDNPSCLQRLNLDSPDEEER